MKVGETIGDYFGDLHAACSRAKLLVVVMIAGWLSWPVAVATVFHPTQAIGFQFWMQSEPVPRFYTWSQATAGTIDAAIGLFGVTIVMLGATVLFYRSAKFWVKLWPMPAVLIGVIGNAGWWIDKAFFDRPGVLLGFSAVALALFCEAVCEHLGADFVFGKGVRPKRGESSSSWA